MILRFTYTIMTMGEEVSAFIQTLIMSLHGACRRQLMFNKHVHISGSVSVVIDGNGVGTVIIDETLDRSKVDDDDRKSRRAYQYVEDEPSQQLTNHYDMQSFYQNDVKFSHTMEGSLTRLIPEYEEKRRPSRRSSRQRNNSAPEKTSEVIDATTSKDDVAEDRPKPNNTSETGMITPSSAKNTTPDKPTTPRTTKSNYSLTNMGADRTNKSATKINKSKRCTQKSSKMQPVSVTSQNVSSYELEDIKPTININAGDMNTGFTDAEFIESYSDKGTISASIIKGIVSTSTEDIRDKVIACSSDTIVGDNVPNDSDRLKNTEFDCKNISTNINNTIIDDAGDNTVDYKINNTVDDPSNKNGDDGTIATFTIYSNDSKTDETLKSKTDSQEEDYIDGIQVMDVKSHRKRDKLYNVLKNKRLVIDYNDASVRNKEDVSFQCDICGKQLRSLQGVRLHKIGIHGLKATHECEQCGLAFKFRNSLRVHMLSKHSDERKHPCDACDKRFLTASHLNEHYQGVHLQMYKYQCQTCGKFFRYGNALKYHERSHTKDYQYICAICGKQFLNNSALIAHHSRHVSTKNFKCTTCGKLYKSKTLLRIHSHRHTRSVYGCETCGQTFVYKCLLKIHEQTHSDKKNYTCTICDKSFRTNSALYGHKTVHAQEHFMCEICSKTFKSKNRLIAHKKRHEPSTEHKCCGRNFATKSELSKHTRTFHTQRQVFICSVCGKETKRADNLRVHMTRVHGYDNKELTIEKLKEMSERLKRASVASNQNDSPTPQSNIDYSKSETIIKIVDTSIANKLEPQSSNPVSITNEQPMYQDLGNNLSTNQLDSSHLLNFPNTSISRADKIPSFALSGLSRDTHDPNVFTSRADNITYFPVMPVSNMEITGTDHDSTNDTISLTRIGRLDPDTTDHNTISLTPIHHINMPLILPPIGADMNNSVILPSHGGLPLPPIIMSADSLHLANMNMMGQVMDMSFYSQQH